LNRHPVSSPPTQHAFNPSGCPVHLLRLQIIAFNCCLPHSGITALSSHKFSPKSEYASCPDSSWILTFFIGSLSLIHALFPQEFMPFFDRRVVPRSIVLNRRLLPLRILKPIHLETFPSSFLKSTQITRLVSTLPSTGRGQVPSNSN
jgi:hypothetical protein